MAAKDKGSLNKSKDCCSRFYDKVDSERPNNLNNKNSKSDEYHNYYSQTFSSTNAEKWHKMPALSESFETMIETFNRTKTNYSKNHHLSTDDVSPVSSEDENWKNKKQETVNSSNSKQKSMDNGGSNVTKVPASHQLDPVKNSQGFSNNSNNPTALAPSAGEVLQQDIERPSNRRHHASQNNIFSINKNAICQEQNANNSAMGWPTKRNANDDTSVYDNYNTKVAVGTSSDYACNNLTFYLAKNISKEVDKVKTTTQIPLPTEPEYRKVEHAFFQTMDSSVTKIVEVTQSNR